VGDGSILVTQSGQTLEKIVASVKKVSDIVAEIAAASREQSSGIEQVNRAVMQMDELTQQNAALVEEATAASQAMAQQVRGLNDLLERYRVAEQLANSVSDAVARHAEPVAAPAPRGERRSAVRPWSKRTPGADAAASKVPQAAGARANGADAKADTEWREF